MRWLSLSYLMYIKNVAKVSHFNNVRCIPINILLLTDFEKQPSRQSYAHLKIKHRFSLLACYCSRSIRFSYHNFSNRFVCSRSGPTEKIEIWTPHNSEIRSKYLRAFSGNSSNVRQPVMSSVQPGNSSKMGLQRRNWSKFAGYSVIVSPSNSYAVQILTVSKPVKTSIELIAVSYTHLTLPTKA